MINQIATVFSLRTESPAERVQGRGVIREEKGQIGCRRYHTHDTCIWQVDPMMIDIALRQ
jgi:hypothetical protein